MIHSAAVLLILFTVGLAGCSNASLDSGQYQPDSTHGMALYRAQCSSCHDTGRQNAPSIKDAEDWDIQTFAQLGIVRQHFAMNLLPGAHAARFTQHDEADVLYFMEQEIIQHDASY